MERESQSAATRLLNALGDKLPLTNFYRFCQLLEQSQPDALCPGSTQSPADDAIRFIPHPGMGFPAGELKSAPCDPERPGMWPEVHVTFMGLYGVESPLPTTYIDDIAQRQEGAEVVAAFLDIFNHRLITQFYRIWRKYSYPATFRSGGRDETSQYLLGLTGLGISGCVRQTKTPVSRFLALLGIMRMPTRTAEGITALVQLLSPETIVTVKPHDKRVIFLDNALKMSVRQPVSLNNRPVMGHYAIDVNSQVLITLTVKNEQEVQGWLPDGELYHDFLALMHVYLGARVNARLQLRIPRSALPDAQLSSRINTQGIQLGRTAVMRLQNQRNTDLNTQVITINIGLWQSLAQQRNRREADEMGDYRY
ncbi:type VI secretion system baseplate subunit TssG [Enterobacter sp.]|uniref:type VI secretion system baseplate subunit TssG n=1 Tax=Enterobacter sp. TaxID=42895 RepID=UPI00296E4B0F|nr:type VI secretion system baseplate subunit TssG [Enterobacter sp.]